MINYILSVVLFAFGPAALQLFLFPDTSIYSISFFVVYFQSLIIFALILSFNRIIISGLLFLLNILSSVLVVWHQHYVQPLNIQTITTQFNEGMTFLEKNPYSIVSLPLLIIWGVYIFKIIYLKYIFVFPDNKKYQLRLIFIIPLISFIGISSYNYHEKIFSIYDFKSYCKILGYAQAWWYEIQTDFDKGKIVDTVINNSYQKVSKRPELLSLPQANHIFIIQAESLDYAAFNNNYAEKKIMPFLNSIRDKAFVYKIQPKERHASAISDFSVISSFADYEFFFSVPYYILSADEAEDIYSLPKAAKIKGYYSRLFHGFVGTFYERENVMKSLGFDEVFFKENLNINSATGDWGYHDKDVVDFMLSKVLTDKNSKSLNFMITLTSHEPFDVPDKNRMLIANPKTELEKYYNSINHVDYAMETLFTKAPKNSLFIVYSDHHSDILKDTSTLLFIYYPNSDKGGHYDIDFSQVPIIIRSILE